MKLLYIGVHSHIGWGAEYWLHRALQRQGCRVVCYDYHFHRKRIGGWLRVGRLGGWRRVARQIRALERREKPDVIFVQRAAHMPARVLRGLKTPLVFWSTEPIQLKNDVDDLLASDVFQHVFVHSHACLDRVRAEFSHLQPACTVMHNACAREILDFESAKERFAIFNRGLSKRREAWLAPSRGLLEVIRGHYGEAYYDDLARTNIAVNIHYSDKNCDDFETGILEGMAKGCVVVSERLDPRTVTELNMADALIQVDSPHALYETLHRLKAEPQTLEEYRDRSREAISRNTWDDRARIFLETFERCAA